MSKYCRPMGLYVTYLDCMECEDKECIQSHRKEIEKGEETKVKKIYLQTYPGQIVYAVFASKKEGYNKNVVLKCRIEQAQVYEEYTEYLAKPIKVVTDKNDDANKYVTIHFRNANIDTGYRNKHGYCYPVFTTKEKCLKWIRN